MKTLFYSVQLGDLHLKNRLVMAPLTRCRASEDRIPNALMADYYRQRSSAGLIISEGTAISPTAVGYPDTPGIWTDKQIEAWKQVTQAVHEAGSLIVMQLWHVGRISHPRYLNGKFPVAPSALAAEGNVSLLRPKVPFPVPRALESKEIPGIIADYGKAAVHAKRAGFDGVEIHAANGYLPDQFLQSSTNQRRDNWGGSVKKRARFLLEITDTVCAAWDAGRVGIHLAPRCDAHDMGDEAPEALFSYLAETLGQKNLAFIFTREHVNSPGLSEKMRSLFPGGFIANEGLTQDNADSLIRSGKVDAVSFGKAFIANPDLPRRFRQQAPLNEADATTFYSGGSKGYTDYPFL